MKTNFDNKTWGRIAKTDTRQFDDAGYAIPGSGEIVPCECCGRGVAIHIQVANADTKQTAILGERCANKMNIYHLSLLTMSGERFVRWQEVAA